MIHVSMCKVFVTRKTMEKDFVYKVLWSIRVLTSARLLSQPILTPVINPLLAKDSIVNSSMNSMAKDNIINSSMISNVFFQKTYESAMSQPQPSYRKPGTPTMSLRNKPPHLLQVQY